MKTPLIGIKALQANCPKALILLLGLCFAPIVDEESVNSAPAPAKLRKCPFTVHTLIKKTEIEYPGVVSNKIKQEMIAEYKNHSYLAGINRAGLAICTGRGTASQATYLIKTLDSKFSGDMYRVDCNAFTLATARYAWHELPPGERMSETNKYRYGPARIVNPGTIGDGILTNYCQDYWNRKKGKK